MFTLSRKNCYSPTRREKCHFHCSLDQITPFPNKFSFLCIVWISTHILWTGSARQWLEYFINCPNPNQNLSAYSGVIAGVVYELLKHHCTSIDLTGDWKPDSYASLTVHNRRIPFPFRGLVADVITVALWGKLNIQIADCMGYNWILHGLLTSNCQLLVIYVCLCIFGKGNYVSVSACWTNMPIAVKDCLWSELCHMDYFTWNFMLHKDYRVTHKICRCSHVWYYQPVALKAQFTRFQVITNKLMRDFNVT